MSRKVFKQGTEDIEIGYFYTEISSTQSKQMASNKIFTTNTTNKTRRSNRNRRQHK